MDNILKHFFHEPEKEFHVRELARLTNKSPTTISKHLRELKRQRILDSRKKFNHLLYKANSESSSFKDMKLFYNIKHIRDSGLIRHLEIELNQPEAIILFGSFGKAEDIPKSDIDILVISSARKQIDLKKYEEVLRRKIDLFVHALSDIEKMKTKNKELLNNWVNGIVLSGFWEVFK